ncbi:hypothetical protein PHYPO_G00109830 [Pangasianodon hypophthalmus]|uniref:Ig-like domain-containing protein n=1 Tax=Pangasianodon hypophthalmus TaxID=310915 RepID=A0A5N5PY39_PANHP|nr:hypothetical protein PHYPO_G00109830 [Pangasianodon hypophthalmus]
MRAAALTILLTAITGTHQMSIRTEQSVNAMCSDTITLPCSVDKNVTVMEYYWTNGTKKLCDYNGPMKGVSPHIHCKYTDNQQLLLTIHHVDPGYNGEYFCILMATSDHKVSTTILEVSDCDERSSMWINSSRQNHACASEHKWINLLVSLTALLSLISHSGI